jgi:two-component system cell cycle response regulator
MTPLSILVVDDNTMNAELAIALLESEGHSVEVDTCGAEFVARLERGPIPDLVLMDSVLPDATGSELLARARTKLAWTDVPMLAVTAQALVGDRERLLADGFATVVTKPIDTRDFVRQVERFAKRK